MKKILILGASGFIGQTLCQVLATSYEVYGTYYQNKINSAVPLIKYDVSKINQLTPILETLQPDLVISSTRGDFAQQLLAHEELAHYLVGNGGRLLYLSTVNVFDALSNKAHTEKEAPDSSSDYGQFKIACENKLKEILGPSLTIIRLPMVMGYHAKRVQTLKDRLKKGLAIDVYRDTFITVHHPLLLAEQIEYMIENHSEGTLHVGSTDVLKYDEFMVRLGKALGFHQIPLNYERIQDQPYYLALATEKSYLPVDLLLSGDQVISTIEQES